MERKTFEAKDIGGGWVLASNASIDRDGDIVEPAGLDLGNWTKAGRPLLWGHDYSSPWHILGRAADVRIDHSGFYMKPEWRKAVSDSDPAAVVASLWDQRLVNAFSIGFAPKRYEPLKGGGRRYTEAEILEVSLVTIGSNQDAVRLAMSKALKLAGEDDDVLTAAAGVRDAILSEWDALGDSQARSLWAMIDNVIELRRTGAI